MEAMRGGGLRGWAWRYAARRSPNGVWPRRLYYFERGVRYIVTVNRLLVLAALVVAAVLAVIILVTSSEIALLTAVGWAFVVAALYLGSLLVP